jgi:hypothetical protein
MKIKRFNQLNESDEFILYTLEDSKKLASNIINEWEHKISKTTDIFQKARLLGSLEAILILNGKLEGGKPYDYKEENYETKMLRMTKELITE